MQQIVIYEQCKRWIKGSCLYESFSGITFVFLISDSILDSIALNLTTLPLDIVALNGTDDKDHLWGKTRLSFEYIYKHHLNEYDWFLKADDDTYVIVENLRYMLHNYSAQNPIYFGSQFQINLTNFYQVSHFDNNFRFHKHLTSIILGLYVRWRRICVE